MKSFAGRRLRNGSAALAILLLIVLWVRAEERSLRDSSFSTGYLFLASIVFLACYNARKKLPQLPLGSTSAWLQLHLYVGLGTLQLFGFHIGWRWPQGAFEILLAGTYLLTVLSGIMGLYLTRTIPAQLSRIGEEVIYERIPAFRRHVCEQARGAALEAVTTSGATTLADYYSGRLIGFFEEPRSLWYRLRPTTARRKALLSELTDLGRFLTDDEKTFSERLFALVRRKDDLDFVEARQGLLKDWLFLHIGLSYALLAMGLLHALLAHAFWGGAL